MPPALPGQSNLTADQRDRYLSMVSSSAKQSGSAQGRIDGLKLNRDVFLTRPIFGFGLGTSLEANFNVAGEIHAAHNLYLEVLIELGLIGFFLYLGYLRSVWRSALNVFTNARTEGATLHSKEFVILEWLPKALIVWL
jgi:O-antigen ligase